MQTLRFCFPAGVLVLKIILYSFQLVLLLRKTDRPKRHVTSGAMPNFEHAVRRLLRGVAAGRKTAQEMAA